MSKFYNTTPIYYVNSRPHLGHLYTTLIADTISRYKTQRGFETFFLTGTDEHGVNIERAADSAGRPVKDHVDGIVDEFKAAFAPYNITNNFWVRTTDDYHKRGVYELWNRAKKNGYIYKGNYEGWYCGNCNMFYAESEAETTKDGALICPVHDRLLEKIVEESYFFKLSAFQQKLLDYFESNPDFIRPESRRNEVISFVKGGLNDLSISRVSVKWGIPVPDDPKHTIYVWFDALANYLTAIGFGNDQFGGEEHFKKFWPADLQLVGKDILRFHSVYWPAFLMAAELDLPKSIFAHGMWLSGGRKMSKTLGNVIDLAVLRKYFQTDAVRYFCLREMVFGQDGDFTYEALTDRVNGDLASGLGNLASRTLTMIRNYFDGVIPSSNNIDSSVRFAVEKSISTFSKEFEELSFSRGLEAIWSAISVVDKFISDAKPWDMAKDEAKREQLRATLLTACEALRFITIALAPVLPESSQIIWGQTGGQGGALSINPSSLKWGGAVGNKISEIKPIFPRLDKKKIMDEIKQAEAPTVELPAAEPKQVTEGVAYISIDDFVKVELRVGEVKTAERVPKADKLLKLSVDLGEAEPRQILAGIAQYYEPEKMIGRKIVVVANLAPRKLRGLESQGMLLAASLGEEGRPVLAGFLEDVPNGARLK